MKIELAEMQRILTRSRDVNENLGTELSDMSKTLEEICANVNSSELTASNQKLTGAIIEISNSVKTNLPLIVDFLSKQVSSYEATNESIKSQIDSLISAVDSIM